MSTLAEHIAHALGQGKERQNGDGWSTICCCHEDTNPSLSIKDDNSGGVILHCHAGCDALAIKDALRARGLLPEWQPNQGSGKDYGQYTEAKPHENEQESFVWKMAKPDDTNIKRYFSNRSITLDQVPKCLKWGSYTDKKTGEQINQIVCAVSKPGDPSPPAVQRLFIHTEQWTKKGQKMLGPCSSRGVWFDHKGDMRSLLVGEGVETTLSAVQTTFINGVAALSATNMPLIVVPDETENLFVLVDSDPAQKGMAGQHAAYELAKKFDGSRENRTAYLVTPDDTCFTAKPVKLDFNDLLKADPQGDTIRERVRVATAFQDLEWQPTNKQEIQVKQNSKPKSPQDIFSKYAVSDDYIDGIGKEVFLYLNLIIKNHILVIIAESGGGKTTFLFFYVAPRIAEQGYTVLYFDADSPPSDHPRMKKHADEHGFQHLIPDLNQGTSVAGLVADLEAMAGDQADLSGYVLIFDTLKKFIDLMSKQSAKDFFVLMRKLTKLGATIVLPGHANKHRDSNGNLVFEGVGDVRSDCDDMIIFEKEKKHDDSIDVTTICDPNKGAKVRGLFKPFSFNISPEREITFYDTPLQLIDFSQTGTPKATDEEILTVAEQYLKDRGEPIIQSELVDYACDAVEGTAGKERVRKLIVKRAMLKDKFTSKEEVPLGARFVFTAGERNKRLFELPPEPPKQQPVFGEAV